MDTKALDELTNKNSWLFPKVGRIQYYGVATVAEAASELAALKARLAEAKRLVGITLYDYTNCGGKISRTALEEMRAFLHPEVK
jgi:hypothetical protein